MLIDLDKITLAEVGMPQNFEDSGRTGEKHKVVGFQDGVPLGFLVIQRMLASSIHDDEFYFETRGEITVPKPMVTYQHTFEQYRGFGVNGRLLELANVLFGESLGTRLWSSDVFISNSSRRVWEKLTEAGKAKYVPYVVFKDMTVDRWQIN